MGFGGLAILQKDDAAAFDAVTAFEHDAHGFGVDAVLFGEDASGERIHGIVVANWNGGLQDDRAGVQIFIHEMHRAACELYAVFEGLPLSFEPGKSGQQRWMNVKDAASKFVDKISG